MIYTFILLAYLIGAIPFSLILGLIFKKIDLREHGSGNVGSTNAARILGYKLGFLTLILDVSKGLLPTLIASKYDFNLSIFIGIACILGHSFPIYLKFKGGKAVATSLGVFLILSPIGVITALLVFIFVLLTTRYVAVASILSAYSIIIPTYLFYDIKLTFLTLCIAILITIRHKSNICNLVNKKECKFL